MLDTVEPHYTADSGIQPGTLFGSGAGGLGWGGGAALGVKLAKPDSFVCAMSVFRVRFLAGAKTNNSQCG